ncbi:MAG: lipocalin family protein [Silicimonas sp.]|nr:lipocalin family protein [Silicimonas sp.]
MKQFFLVGFMLIVTACGQNYRDASVQMTSMAVFDPVKYAGLWYEVARFPAPFQKGCTNTEVEYAVIAPGTLSVRNSCMKNGKLKVIEGRATVVGPGRLKVRLGGVPFAGDYWVLWVDEGYRTAVVGAPSGRVGWILNRDPEIPADRLNAARQVLDFNGYRLSDLIMTRQDGS